MAFIQPFRALRPTGTNAASVSSVPYDVVNTEEARALAAGNPLSFLHVTRPEIDVPPDTDPYSQRVYDKARENLVWLDLYISPSQQFNNTKFWDAYANKPAFVTAFLVPLRYPRPSAAPALPQISVATGQPERGARCHTR